MMSTREPKKPKRIFGIGEMAEALGVSRQYAHVLLKKGKLPEPGYILPDGSAGWTEEDNETIQRWIKEQAKE